MSESTADPSYVVVVGVSGASRSSAALRWAADQVTLRQGRLVVVRVVRIGAPAATPAPASAGRIRTSEDVLGAEERRLAADVESELGADHGAELRVVRGGRRRGLLAEARGADLLVLDGPRTASSPLLAQRIALDAPCPVVVMPQPGSR